MRQTDQDGEHIWLRQSVTFTVNGQTRTVEMTIPVRPGAPAEEIEQLLAEAEAGMQRLAHRLDNHVASLLDAAGASAPTPAQPATPAATTPAPASAPPAPTVSAPAAPAPAEASRPSTPAAPAHPAATRPERPAAAAAPARSPAAAPAATNSPSRPAPTPAAPPDRARQSGPLAVPASAAPDGGELSRKDFIAATTEMGLTIKQVMERLRVRTLEGLNLNEALEALRRQMLRDGETAQTAQTSRPAAPTAPRTTPEPAAPRYFEEEDDNYDVTFTEDGDDALSEEFGPYEAAGMSGGAALETSGDLSDVGAFDDFDLDDVPDFGPPPTAHSSSHAAQAPTRRAAPARTAATPPPAPPATTPAPDQEDPAPDVSPEAQRVAELRAIRGGGAPTTHQRTAYRNIVVNELGEPEAVALVRGIWRVNPERLGPEQLDALISWGKQDTFAEEAAAVLTTLRAERQQAATSENASASASGATPRPAPRARPPQPPRAPSGGR